MRGRSYDPSHHERTIYHNTTSCSTYGVHFLFVVILFSFWGLCVSLSVCLCICVGGWSNSSKIVYPIKYTSPISVVQWMSGYPSTRIEFPRVQ